MQGGSLNREEDDISRQERQRNTGRISGRSVWVEVSLLSAGLQIWSLHRLSRRYQCRLSISLISRRYKEDSAKSKKTGLIRLNQTMVAGESTAEGIRTPDLLVRSQSLYPTELQPHMSFEEVALADSSAIIAPGFSECNPFFQISEKFFSVPASHPESSIWSPHPSKVLSWS